MLTELKLTNFRIFDDEVTVRFRPITVLIGRNSSGKSSIIKFLLMLQQSMYRRSSQFLTSEGDRVDLGVFSELKNSLTRKRNMAFELSAQDIVDEPTSSVLRYLREYVFDSKGKWIYKAGGTVPYNPKTNLGRAYFAVTDNDARKELIRIEPEILDDSNFWDGPLYLGIAESTPMSGVEDPLSEIRTEFIKRMDLGFDSIIQWTADVDIIEFMNRQVDTIHHLSPVRDESQRVIVASSRPADDVGQTGMFALPHLQEIMSGDSSNRKFVLKHLNGIVGIENVRFDTSSGYVTRALGKSSATGAEVLIADFGFGVGQCLPIIVQGAIMDPHTTLMVEQPEAQLHPTAQLELGSYFADLWKERKVASIIETHSDNILLRLRRLIANGELNHEDVSVAYFTFDEENRNMPIIKNLDINEDGSMEAGLPMEFFGADIIESLNLGVGM